MNNLTNFGVGASLLLAGAALFASLSKSPDPLPQPDEASAHIARLERDIQELRQQLQSMKAAPVAASQPARSEVVTIDDEQIAAAVAHWLEANGKQMAALTNVVEAAAEELVTVDDAFATLTGNSNMWNGNDGLYRKLLEAGKLEELIERFKQRARANPNDAQAQLDLANSYLAYTQLDNSKWQMSVLADQALDEALDIDEQHWEARFTKAMSYSFWPDALGKKKEAIAHFERLAAQQDTMPIHDSQVQTYVFLGNLLDQRGERERALEAWQRGLRRHPGNKELAKLLGQ